MENVLYNMPTSMWPAYILGVLMALFGLFGQLGSTKRGRVFAFIGGVMLVGAGRLVQLQEHAFARWDAKFNALLSTGADPDFRYPVTPVLSFVAVGLVMATFLVAIIVMVLRRKVVPVEPMAMVFSVAAIIVGVSVYAELMTYRVFSDGWALAFGLTEIGAAAFWLIGLISIGGVAVFYRLTTTQVAKAAN